MTNPINSTDRTYNWQLQPYVSWKGNNYKSLGLINSRPETNGSWILSKQPSSSLDGNAFLPRPIKHWRKQLTDNPIRRGTRNVTINELETPGLIINTNCECREEINNLIWIPVSGEQFPTQGVKVAYGDGRWIAVGNGMYTSTDGLNWEVVSGINLSGRGLAYGNGRWVAAGAIVPPGASPLITSLDGINWFNCIIPGSIPPYIGTSVAFGKDNLNNDAWAVVGEGLDDRILKSFDGIGWNGPAPDEQFVEHGNNIIYADSVGWVAVGKSPSIMYSVTVNNWYSANYPVEFNEGINVAYANGLWVAVGAGTNTILTSTNMVDWNAVSGIEFTIQGNDVAYGNGRWVAVGSGTNTILTSDNGINWEPVSGLQFTDYGKSVAYGDGRWVALGSGTITLLTSIDGINWDVAPGIKFTNFGLDVEYYNGRWIAVGSGINTILTTDANTIPNKNFIVSNLQLKNNSNIYDNSETTITYADVSNCWNGPIGKRICCNPEANLITYKTAPLEKNYISYSYYLKNRCYTYNQNISTTKVTGNTYFNSNGIATYPTEFPNGCQVLHKKECSSDCCKCYCGTNGRIQDMIYKPNNRQFAKQGATSSRARINALKANAIDQGGALFNNANGLKKINNGICSLNGDSVYYVKTKPTPCLEVKCGPAYVPPPPPEITFFVASGLKFTREGNGIAYNGVNRWVAVGGGGYSMLYSNDGITWFETLGSKFPASSGGSNVVYANNIWVAVGSGGSNTILYSYNGITWFTCNGVLFTNTGTSIAYGNNKWVAVGYDTYPGLNTILQSDDGINWGTVTGTMFTNGIGLQVEYNNRWVAVGRGDNTILYSDNGNTWNPVSSSPTGVKFSISGNKIYCDRINNRWVAVGEGTYTILYSDNGIIWTASPNSFSLRGNSVYYDGYSRWVAVGQTTQSILTSIDRVNWNVVNGIKFSLGGNDVMYANNRWVAVGTNNSILTSFDGINWELANGTLFSVAGFGKRILYGNRWVALGYGTFERPTILYSN